MTAEDERAARRWARRRLLTGRIPGQTITKGQWELLTEGRDRPLTQDPIGTTPHPQPILNEETNRQ